MRSNILPLYFISVSLVGLFLLAALTFNILTLEVTFSRQKPVIGSIFGLICLLGVTAGVFPSKCSGTLHIQKRNQSGSAYSARQQSTQERAPKFEGHHPNCGNFSAHVFRLRGKTYCAGCTGLVLGAMISLAGTLVYFFTDLFPRGAGVAFFWFGFVGVTLGLFQYNLFNVHGTFLHVLLNVIFVLGAFLLLIGMEEMTSNLVLEVYFVALTLFWILTRILLSQREHRKICGACGLKSCGFLE